MSTVGILVLVQQKWAGGVDAGPGCGTAAAAYVTAASVHLVLLISGHVRRIAELKAVACSDQDPVGRRGGEAAVAVAAAASARGGHDVGWGVLAAEKLEKIKFKYHLDI
jgi:hypothetical protein